MFKPATIFPQVRSVNCWDLDGTIINSFHRVMPCFKDNGDLDLSKYRREACTHELIQQDTLLPLVEYMRQSIGKPDTVNLIITARNMGKSDYYYLRRQGLRGRNNSNIRVFSRDTLSRYFSDDHVNNICYSGDAVYKSFYFELIKRLYPNASYTMIDDHKGVLKAAESHGFNALDATMLNDVLGIGVRIGGETFIDESLEDDNDYQYLCQRLQFCWDTMTDEERAEYSVKPNDFLMKLAS